MNLRIVVLLSIAHVITDVNQGALPAILPFFISEYGLTYSAAAAIVFATNSASAVVQPAFGYAADRLSKPWLLPLAILVAGLGLGLTGVVHSYKVIIFLTIFSGVGIAAFHPQAARLINFGAGGKKGTTMSFFGLGGTLGFALGPMLATTALLAWGLKGTTILIIPVTIMATLIATQIPKFRILEHSEKEINLKRIRQPGEDKWRSFGLLSVMIMGRSVIFFGLITFVPLYWTGYLHRSIAEGAIALSTLTLSGVVGNFFGGWLSDRIGLKKMTLLGFTLLAIVLPIFIMVENPVLAFLLLIPIGFAHSSTYSPSIVMGQEYLPNHIGFSSGVTLGMAVAFGGITAPFIGMIADQYGIWYSLALVASVPSLCLVLSAFLPTIQTPSLTT
ncbi:MFS transporter [bacterium]|nr:MFS transporter [bacterium]